MEAIKLSKIAYLLNGYAFKSAKYVERGIRIIRIANVQDGFIADDKPCYYPPNTDEDISKYLLAENDLLVSLTGNVGRVGMLSKDFLPAALNQRVSCIRIKDSKNVDKKYLYYYFRQKAFVKECVEASKGVAQLNLSTKWLENYMIPIPPLPEQERIVARIEELFSQLDAGVETLKKTKAQLAVYRQAVLKEAFESVVEESSTCNVEDVCFDIKVGIVIKPAQYYTSATEGIRAFRSANVREFSVNNTDWVYLTKAGHEANLRSEIHAGDVLVVRSGYPGTACVVPPEYDGSNAIDILIAVPDKELVLPEYLCAYTNSPLGRKIVQEKKRGVAQAHFNVSGYSKTPIIVPCLNTQRKVIEVIESRLSVCDSIEQTVDAALQQAEAMRQGILKQAFEDKL